MKDHPAAARLEDLLSQGSFVRALARSLIFDEHRAEEITQETLLAALKNPPAAGWPLRSWLAGVVRNLSRAAMRDEIRRRKRERKAARHEVLRSTAEIVEQESQRRSLVEAVLALKKPYRSAVLYRFYDDLPPREIARLLDIPVETVRTHVQRGLARLRKKLDRSHGGGRKAWCLALAPLAGVKVAASSACASAPAAAVMSGALVMSTKLKIVLAAALLLAATFAVWRLLPGDLDRLHHELHDGEIVFADAADSGAVLSSWEKTASPGESDALFPKNAAREAITATGLFVSGRVTNIETGEPVRSFTLERCEGRSYHSRHFLIDRYEDDEGRFAFPIRRGGQYTIAVGSLGFSPEYVDIEVAWDQGLAGLCVKLDPGVSVSGRVVEDRTGHPVAGALIAPSWPRIALLKRLWNDPACTYPHAWTDVSGRFTLKGLRKSTTGLSVDAFHPDFVKGSAGARPGKKEVTIRLEEGIRVFGRVLDDRGAPVAGVTIGLFPESDNRIILHVPVSTDSDGAFLTPPVGPGRVCVLAGPLPGETPGRPSDGAEGFARERKIVELKDRDVEVCFGPAENHLSWRGTFYDSDGNPVAGGTVAVHPHGFPRFHFRFDPNQVVEKTCDGRGRFELQKLVPGAYQLHLTFPSPYAETRIVPVVFDHAGIEERDIHAPGGRIRGVVVDELSDKPKTAGWVEAYNLSGKLPGSWYCFGNIRSRVDEKGKFCLRGLRPGKYHVWYCGENIEADSYDLVDENGCDLHPSIEEGQVVEDVCIRIPSKGVLCIDGSGFEAVREDDIALDFESGSDSMSACVGGIESNGSFEYRARLDPGVWKVRIALYGGPPIVHEIRVGAGLTVEIPVHRNELSLPEGFTVVTGSYLLGDGTPLSAGRFSFRKAEEPGPGCGRRFLSCKTDSKGEFSLEGFTPGRWSVSVRVYGTETTGYELFLPGLEIPVNAASPYFVRLVLPRDGVSGALYDNWTGRPFERNTNGYTVAIQDAPTGEMVLKAFCRGSRFEATGVPGGEYRLRISAYGGTYIPYESERFSLLEGGVLDLGAIGMDPAGYLIVDPVDSAGRPVRKRVRIAFEGSGSKKPACVFVPRAHCHGYVLPAGATSLRMSVEGYREKTVTITLEPGEVRHARLVFEPVQ